MTRPTRDLGHFLNTCSHTESVKKKNHTVTPPRAHARRHSRIDDVCAQSSLRVPADVRGPPASNEIRSVSASNASEAELTPEELWELEGMTPGEVGGMAVRASNSSYSHDGLHHIR